MARTLLPVAILAVLVTLAVSSSSLVALAFGHTEERTHTVSGPVTRVVVDGASGDVALMAASVRDVTIHERRRYGLRKPHLDVALRDGVLHVAVRCGGWSGGCADDLDIVVPHAVRDAVVRADSGDVSLAGLTGDAFSATSESGDVRANRIAGALALRTDSGDVEAGDVHGRVELHAGSGDVTGHGLRSPALTATSDSGDVELAVPAGAYRLDATTGSGDAHVSGISRDDLSPRRIQARTGSGDVTVRGQIS
jgi:hypothetical protein